MKSHFFTDKIVNWYVKKMSSLLKPNDLVIMNLTSIIPHVFEPYGTLTSTSTLIGTRKSLKRSRDFIYEDEPDYPKEYGGANTPPLSRITSTKPTRRRSTRTRTRRPTRRRQLRFTINTPPRETRIREIQNETERNIEIIINTLARSSCKGEIHPDYGRNSVRRGITVTNAYDIVIIADSSIKQKQNIQDKLQDIYGMMVVQKGECIKYPQIYAINLICANKPNISKFLLGLYMCTIKKTPNLPPYGLLEVGGNYTNVSAYCAYQKFGFNHEEQLIDNCFPDDARGNLPMVVDIDMFSLDDIFKIIKDEINLPKDDLCYIRGNLQEKIATYQKIKYVLENQPNYSYLRNFYDENKLYIDNMYREIGIVPDYMVRSKIEPNYILQYMDNYITQLYLTA